MHISLKNQDVLTQKVFKLSASHSYVSFITLSKTFSIEAVTGAKIFSLYLMMYLGVYLLPISIVYPCQLGTSFSDKISVPVFVTISFICSQNLCIL